VVLTSCVRNLFVILLSAYSQDTSRNVDPWRHDRAGCPDVAFFNGKVLNVDKDFKVSQAVTIKDGKILFSGSQVDLDNLYPPAAQRIDLHGSTVIPGIIDSHIHMMAIGLERLRLSVSHAQAIADVLDAVRKNAAASARPMVVTSQIDFAPGQLREKRLPNRWNSMLFRPTIPSWSRAGALQRRK